MLTQYCIKLNTPLPPQAAYALYAALLEQAPADFAEAVHQTGVTPVSQYLQGDCWYVSLLGDVPREALAPVLDTLDSVTLRKGQQVAFTEKTIRTTTCLEELLAAPAPDRFQIQLRTPVAFKSAGHYQLLPTQRLLLQSLILKWNGCFGDVCPIEDDGGGLDALSSGICYRKLKLDTREFRLKNTTISGVTGIIGAENHLTGFHRQLAAALLEFGTYAGVGIKTALGMGGITVKTDMR